MDWGFVKRLVTTIYIIIIIFIMVVGFAYSNQDDAKIRENYVDFSNGWTIDGVDVVFPYENENEFIIENTLPVVYGDQFLILKCYYNDVEVYVDDVSVYRSLDNRLFGVSTNVGKKEVHVGMKPEYAGKTVKAKIQLQHSFYGAELFDSFIITRSGYGIKTLKDEGFSIILSVVLIFSGIWEALIAIHFILRKSLILRKLSFQALLYAGFFSLLSGIWMLCETRLPTIIFGNNTGFAILEIMCFVLMPLAFLELVRAANFRVSKRDNIVDGIFGIVILGSFVVCLFGFVQWGNIVIFAHGIDLLIVGLTAYYSYSSIKAEKRKSERRLIAIGNSVFLFVCLIALAMYINNIDSNYNIIVIIGLMVYISTQIGLIYRRIGLKVEEEAELVQIKELAYTDELTKLTNRRYFYEEVNAIEDKELSPDTTIVFFDVNRLKYTNDTLGHDAGDELLLGAAECIKKSFGDNATCVISRMGGDEFIAMLIVDPTELKKRLDKLTKLTAEWKGNYVSEVSISVGTASRREHPQADINELYKIADDNMYLAKKEFYKNSGFDRRSS